jgi:hypothetical protein
MLKILGVFTQSNNMVKAKKSKKIDNSKINGVESLGLATQTTVIISGYDRECIF